ncbi:MAG: YcxB family protein [Acidobacteria bacterium]|nr:YcxB family protein [Acidobacteriota bacterium]MBV9068089.1 YcxB family protein [Acidobacteriota bacterium]MBV9184624.1 YcxB family protein [Acidobacteriota bacterium]
MIRFEGTLTPAIYRRGLAVSGGSMPLVGLALTVAGVINLCFADLTAPVSWAMPSFLLIFGVTLLFMPRMTVTRAFATDKLLSEPITGEADEQGVRMEIAHGRSDLPWAMMHKVVVTPTLVIIYQSAQLLRIVPREFFADEESWEAFRRLAAAAPSVAKPPRGPIRVVLLWIVIIVAVFVVWTLFKG